MGERTPEASQQEHLQPGDRLQRRPEADLADRSAIREEDGTPQQEAFLQVGIEIRIEVLSGRKMARHNRKPSFRWGLQSR